MDSDFRPTRLPRGIPSIIIGTVYHPPSAVDALMLDFLSKNMSSIEARFPDSGIILLGDFNKLNTSRLKNNFKMKQIIKFPTRGHNTLDLILTNLKAYYDCPIKRSPFGLSDHVTVEVRPLARSELSKTKFSVKSRDLRPTKHLAMRAYLEAVDR